MNNLIHQNMKIVSIVLFAMLFALNFKVTAQTKNTIEFKTSIINQSEQPMADGNYNFRFSIYNAATGGTALWSEDRFGVPVRKAAISVDLGSFVPFPQNLFKNTSLYLQICLDANLAGGDGFGECAGGFEENFKPRKVVTGVPWAFNASSLGPVTVSTGDTAYNLDTFGSESTLLSLGFNDVPKFSVDSKGTVKLTEESDLFFGDNISLKNSSSPETAGAGLIGVSTAGLQNITGTTLQTVITNLDPLLRWKANGSAVFYNLGNVGIGINAPSYALDVVGTGHFTNGIIIGDNPNNVAGAIRWNGTAFEGHNGVSWNPLGGGAGATTDNGAGLTYVTNTTNSFAIGGTTTLAPYVFDPVAGALIKRNLTLRNDPATAMANMLTIDSSGANAQVGGNKNGITGNYAYTPNGGTGVEIYNTQESVLVINAGDGTAIDRARGYRNTITNNSSGLVGGAFNLSTINTNNGTEQFQTGYASTVQNNGTLTGQMTSISGGVTNSGDAGVFMIGVSGNATNNVGGVTDQITASYFQTTNNGTSDYQYGSRNVVNNNGTINNQLWAFLNGVENDGTAQVAYGLQNSFLNHAVGVVNSDSFGIYNDNSNQGTVNGNLYGIYNNISNTGTLLGNKSGIRSTDGTTTVDINLNDTYAISTIGGAVKFSNQVIVGNSTGVDEAGAIRWTGAAFEGYDGISWNSLGGVGTTQWGNTGADIYFNSGNVGIGTTTPAATAMLDVNGGARINSLGVGQLNDGTYALEVAGAGQFANEVLLGNSLADTAGAIRWTGTDFEGYNGSAWVSFTGGATTPPGTPTYINTNSAADSNSTSQMIVNTTPSGTDRFMLLSVHYRDATNTVLNADFNGSSFTKVCSSQQDDYAVEIWYLINPAAVNGNVTVNWTSTVPDKVAAVSNFEQIDQGVPVDGSGCNTSPGGVWDTSHSITIPTTPGELVFGAASSYSGDFNLQLNPTAAGSTEAYNVLSSNVIGEGNYLASEGDADTTVSWDGTTSGPTAWPWSAAAVSLFGSNASGSTAATWLLNGSNAFYSAGSVGIKDNTPSYDLDVNGVIRSTHETIIGNSLADTAGAIRWTGTDFEGYDGSTWNSFTSGGGGGNQWTNDGLDNIYYNMGTVGIGGFAGSDSLTVQGSSYLNGAVGIQTNPTGTYALEVGGPSFFNDSQFDGSVAISTGADPSGLYALEVGAPSFFNGIVGINTAPDNLFALNILGDVHIEGNQYITNGSLCVDGGTGCPALSPGGIYGDLAYSEFDVAENILTQQDVEAGDLVSVQEGQTEVVRKSNGANESNLIGIISTDPGSLGGVQLKPRDGFKVLPLVLSGRVPVKMSTENGAINVGDPITSSSIPGVAMKATQSKTKIIGYAMQAYDQAGVAKIIVFYQPGYLP